ncbi:uncharacterized protein [Eurosta solidaginis]|uniref:uncharacterized protein n=1 Tax=Eurosta solidaginis TaxID=178769 RepID=UPI00353151D6
MLNFNVIRGTSAIRNAQFNAFLTRTFRHEFNQKEPKNLTIKEDNVDLKSTQNAPAEGASKFQQKDTLSGAIKRKYQIFYDEDSSEIFDVEEERQRYQIEEEPKVVVHDEFFGINLNRGKHGIFDIEDLVDVLRKESAEDVFVCSVPKELKYIDYMVVCSGRSYRHMLAIAEFVRRICKVKRNKSDILPKIEGEKSRQWMALDLGNIALHVFSPEAREEYDLESLWAIGIEYDKETQKPQDPLVELFEKHSIELNDMKPLSKVTADP